MVVLNPRLAQCAVMLIRSRSKCCVNQSECLVRTTWSMMWWSPDLQLMALATKWVHRAGRQLQSATLPEGTLTAFVKGSQRASQAPSSNVWMTRMSNVLGSFLLPSDWQEMLSSSFHQRMNTWIIRHRRGLGWKDGLEGREGQMKDRMDALSKGGEMKEWMMEWVKVKRGRAKDWCDWCDTACFHKADARWLLCACACTH